MANNKSTKKRIIQAENNRQRNRALKTRMRTAVRELRSAIDAGDGAKAKSLLPETIQRLDGTAHKGGIHRNAAARTKSRLTKAVANLDS